MIILASDGVKASWREEKLCGDVVADKHDLLCVRIVIIYKCLDLFRPIQLFTVFPCGDIPLSSERLREHEGAAPYVFMVDLLRVVRFGESDRLPGVGMELYGLLIHANERPLGVIRQNKHFIWI